jgi:hypothetical protein
LWILLGLYIMHQSFIKWDIFLEIDKSMLCISSDVWATSDR